MKDISIIIDEYYGSANTPNSIEDFNNDIKAWKKLDWYNEEEVERMRDYFSKNGYFD